MLLEIPLITMMKKEKIDLQEKRVQEEVTEVEVTEVAAAAIEVDAAEVASEVAVAEQPAAKREADLSPACYLHIHLDVYRNRDSEGRRC